MSLGMGTSFQDLLGPHDRVMWNTDGMGLFATRAQLTRDAYFMLDGHLNEFYPYNPKFGPSQDILEDVCLGKPFQYYPGLRHGYNNNSKGIAKCLRPYSSGPLPKLAQASRPQTGQLSRPQTQSPASRSGQRPPQTQGARAKHSPAVALGPLPWQEGFEERPLTSNTRLSTAVRSQQQMENKSTKSKSHKHSERSGRTCRKCSRSVSKSESKKSLGTKSAPLLPPATGTVTVALSDGTLFG